MGGRRVGNPMRAVNPQPRHAFDLPQSVRKPQTNRCGPAICQHPDGVVGPRYRHQIADHIAGQPLVNHRARTGVLSLVRRRRRLVLDRRQVSPGSMDRFHENLARRDQRQRDRQHDQTLLDHVERLLSARHGVGDEIQGRRVEQREDRRDDGVMHHRMGFFAQKMVQHLAQDRNQHDGQTNHRRPEQEPLLAGDAGERPEWPHQRNQCRSPRPNDNQRRKRIIPPSFHVKMPRSLPIHEILDGVQGFMI